LKGAWLERLGALVVCVSGVAGAARAADAPEAKPKSAWSNSTELSYVITQGNSNVQSLGFKDTFEFRPKNGLMKFRLDSLHTQTSDDPYLQVQSGLTFLPGEVPTNFSTNAVYPGTEPDVTRDFVEGRYDHKISKEFTWNAGASWDRNLEAGIVSRSIVFAGVGDVWQNRDSLKFRSSYGLSYTNRVEDLEDPEKDQRFPGARVTSYFMQKWGKSTTYDVDFTGNVSLKDFADYTADLTQGVSAAMSKRLALKVSLQLTYASEPALQDVDVIVHVQLIDPDGIPGSGDEFYETIDSGGTQITVGEDSLRKKNLDTTFRTSLQINF
jgi:putative salt-induced outer membrane protein YdiY